MSRVQTVTVGPGDGDQRLDRWLKRLFPQLAQGRIEKMCRKGETARRWRAGQGFDPAGGWPAGPDSAACPNPGRWKAQPKPKRFRTTTPMRK